MSATEALKQFAESMRFVQTKENQLGTVSCRQHGMAGMKQLY